MSSVFDTDFLNFKTAENFVIEYCKDNFHPVHIDSKEKVASYNKKLKEGAAITEINADEIHSCRWTCKHYGKPKRSAMLKNKHIRPNQNILSRDCKMCIHVSYNQRRRCYQVKHYNLEHNHPIGKHEYETYSSERRPKGLLLEQTKNLLSRGVDPAIVVDNLKAAGLRTTRQDLLNLRQRFGLKGVRASSGTIEADDLKPAEIKTTKQNLRNRKKKFGLKAGKISSRAQSTRYNKALSLLQPLASHLSEMKPAKFERAMLWLQNMSQQGLSDEWELKLSRDEDSQHNHSSTSLPFPSTSSQSLPSTSRQSILSSSSLSHPSTSRELPLLLDDQFATLLVVQNGA